MIREGGRKRVWERKGGREGEGGKGERERQKGTRDTENSERGSEHEY